MSAVPEEDALRGAIHAAYIEVGKGKLERSFRRADFITGICGAVGTTYTGLLALVYSVSSKSAHPLPPRGIAPAIYLAAALFFSAVNIGFIRASGKGGLHPLREATTWEEQEERLGDFLRWIDRGAMSRSWALRCAVVSLGAGVALLPLPFLDLNGSETSIAIATVTSVALMWLIADWLLARARATKATANPPKLP